jgi:hypothetical protein
VFQHRRRRAPGRPSEKVDPKLSTNRSSRARRQGVDCSTALGGVCQAWVLRRLRCRKSAHRRVTRVARSRVPRSPAPRPARRGQRSDVDRDRVPTLPVHGLRGDLDGRAARRGTAPTLRLCRDRDGVHAVGARAGVRGGGSAQGLRVAGHIRGRDPVADASAVGACRTRCDRRHESVVARRRESRSADRDRSRTTVAADSVAVPSSIWWGQCDALMGIVVCSTGGSSPPR